MCFLEGKRVSLSFAAFLSRALPSYLKESFPVGRPSSLERDCLSDSTGSAFRTSIAASFAAFSSSNISILRAMRRQLVPEFLAGKGVTDNIRDELFSDVFRGKTWIVRLDSPGRHCPITHQREEFLVKLLVHLVQRWPHSWPKTAKTLRLPAASMRMTLG